MRGAWFAILAGCGEVEPEAPPAAIVEVAAPPPAPVPPAQRYAATEILVRYRGAVDAPTDLPRTDAQARELASDVHSRAAAGEAFDELARAFSEAPSAPRGGAMGVFLAGTMAPELEQALAAIDVGAITPPIRTAFGWHVLRREPVVQARAAQIVVATRGAAQDQRVRTPASARARAADAMARLRAGEPFASVARDLSDDPSAASGGDIGVVTTGQLVPTVEAALFALSPGEFTEPIETSYGLHIVLRTE